MLSTGTRVPVAKASFFWSANGWATQLGSAILVDLVLEAIDDCGANSAAFCCLQLLRAQLALVLHGARGARARSPCVWLGWLRFAPCFASWVRSSGLRGVWAVRSPSSGPPTHTHTSSPTMTSHKVMSDYSNLKESENIKVFIRLRPPANGKEVTPNMFELGNGTLALRNPNDDGGGSGGHKFKFDASFDQNASQETVFKSVAEPLVSKVLSGFNACCFAYGQTGSGKTHSIYGSRQQEVRCDAMRRAGGERGGLCAGRRGRCAHALIAPRACSQHAASGAALRAGPVPRRDIPICSPPSPVMKRLLNPRPAFMYYSCHGAAAAAADAAAVCCCCCACCCELLRPPLPRALRRFACVCARVHQVS
jgi:hypothetical protein